MAHVFTPEDEKKPARIADNVHARREHGLVLKCKEAAVKAGIPSPEREERISTNFTRY